MTSSSNRRLNALAMNAAMGSGSCRRDPRSVKMTVVSCVDLPDNDNELKHWAKASPSNVAALGLGTCLTVIRHRCNASDTNTSCTRCDCSTTGRSIFGHNSRQAARRTPRPTCFEARPVSGTSTGSKTYRNGALLPLLLLLPLYVGR